LGYFNAEDTLKIISLQNRWTKDVKEKGKKKMTLMKENHKYKEKMKMLQKPSETHY
jgi:hypothetical protein